jgi:hypothetical protein
VSEPGQLPLWQVWAPPLDPPAPGGLPREVAEQVVRNGERSGLCDHCVAAELWEAYAGMLPPAPVVASVATGAQSVSYGAGSYGTDQAGLAMARATWHRQFCDGQLTSVPLALAPPEWAGPWPDWWEVLPGRWKACC